MRNVRSFFLYRIERYEYEDYFFASDDGVFDVAYVVGWLIGWLLGLLGNREWVRYVGKGEGEGKGEGCGVVDV